MEKPENLGKAWTYKEEDQLLEELSKNIPVKLIAQNHKRTNSGIQARQKLIAYKLYLKKISIEEIIDKTKLDELCIHKVIQKYEN